MTGSRFGSGLSTSADAARAAEEACRTAREGLGEGPVTLAVVFASPDLALEADVIIGALEARLAPAALVGCMGEAIIGTGREVEDGPALSVWAARLPGADVTTFRLDAEMEDGEPVVTGWPPAISEGRPEPGAAPVILLADPFTFPAEAVLNILDARRIPAVGGLASGGRGAGDHRLFVNGQVVARGAVGVVVSGADVLTVVSQGCLPVGPEMVVTDGEGSVVAELAGRPAVAKLEEVIDGLEPGERRLAGQGLLAGIVIDENRPDYERGDFLVRGILGGDPESGALFVGEQVRVGQTMRLHVRDAESAHVDLDRQLERARVALAGAAPGGALVFSCNGRGSRMFDTPDHDAAAVRDALGSIPVAGFFCNGEIGPVGGRSFLHGFTATMAVFTDVND
jgi:small ligand-binding sensory domain FIST